MKEGTCASWDRRRKWSKLDPESCATWAGVERTELERLGGLDWIGWRRGRHTVLFLTSLPQPPPHLVTLHVNSPLRSLLGLHSQGAVVQSPPRPPTPHPLDLPTPAPQAVLLLEHAYAHLPPSSLLLARTTSPSPSPSLSLQLRNGRRRQGGGRRPAICV